MNIVYLRFNDTSYRFCSKRYDVRSLEKICRDSVNVLKSYVSNWKNGPNSMKNITLLYGRTPFILNNQSILKTHCNIICKARNILARKGIPVYSEYFSFHKNYLARNFDGTFSPIVLKFSGPRNSYLSVYSRIICHLFNMIPSERHPKLKRIKFEEKQEFLQIECLPSSLFFSDCKKTFMKEMKRADLYKFFCKKPIENTDLLIKNSSS